MKKTCKKCGKYYWGVVCECQNPEKETPKTCIKKIDTSNLTDLEQQALKEATAWYNTNYINFDTSKYSKCFFTDIQEALAECLYNIKNFKEIKNSIYYTLPEFTKLLMYGWLCRIFPDEFEKIIKEKYRLTKQSINKNNAEFLNTFKNNEDIVNENLTSVVFGFNQKIKKIY